MGERGPKPLPTVVLEKRGSWRAKGRKGEPQYPVARLDVSRTSREAVLAVLEKIADALAEAGVTAAPDALAWMQLVDTVEQYLAARSLLCREDGSLDPAALVAVSDKGSVYQHPAVGIMNKCREQIMRFCGEFGLTPSARVGLTVGGKQEEQGDAKRRFFKQAN